MSNQAQQAERFEAYGFRKGPLLGLSLFVCAVAGIAWVWLSVAKMDRWPIRWLEIDGAFERVSAEQVRTRVSPLVNESFFTLDPTALQDAARELAWVDRVVVQKTWPDTVRLVVREFVPVAHWTNGMLIATNGEPFSVPGADGIQGLPWLEGPDEGVGAVITQWQAFNNLLLPTGLEIDHIRLDRRGAWYLRLTNGTQVQIGREEALPRLQRMVDSWAQVIRLKDTAPLAIDLRYSNGFAIRWPDSPPGVADNRK